MEKRRIERVLSRDLETSIGLRGVREDDEFMMDIFQDRKRVFKLNRTRYLISADKDYSFNMLSSEIKLPYQGVNNNFEIVMICDSSRGDHNAKSRYLMRSSGEQPFRINGIYSFEAFLERGDVVDIGYNRIHFKKPKRKLSLVPEHFKMTEEVIRSEMSILLEGETGTGKTTLAKKIHEESGRAGRFVHVNLSAFSPSLIESEIFGHVKGAFTGALNPKRGAIVEANKGTLFLDEIDSLTLDLQTKLLLFLDDYQVRAVGADHSSKVDVRLVFASGSKLKNKVDEGKMRKDFYYRLQSGCAFTMTSLREQPEKIKLMIEDFEEKNAVIFSQDAIEFYCQCQWPGNIRQLLSHLQKKKIYGGGKKIVLDQIDKDLLQDSKELRQLESSELITLEKIKMDYCYNVYVKVDRNLNKTAKILEVSPNTLKAYLIKKKAELEGESGNDEIINVDF